MPRDADAPNESLLVSLVVVGMGWRVDSRTELVIENFRDIWDISTNLCTQVAEAIDRSEEIRSWTYQLKLEAQATREQIEKQRRARGERPKRPKDGEPGPR